MPVEGRDLRFKTNAIRSEGPGDWVTYQLRKVFRNCRRPLHAKAKAEAALSFLRPSTTRSAVKTSWLMLMPSAAPTRAHLGWMDRTSRTSKGVWGAAMAWRTGACAQARDFTDRTRIRRVFLPKANGKLNAAGHLDPARGSGLHDSSDAGAGDRSLKPIFHQNNTPTVPGATPSKRWSRWKSSCFVGHPEVVDADLAGLLREHSTLRFAEIGSAPNC